MEPRKLFALMRKLGCNQLVIKELAPNDNSKNQVYFGLGFQALNLFPHHDVRPDGGRFKAPLPYSWITADGSLSEAPHAQLILYPQYPEVRFSGFLRGSPGSPRELMASRDKGRILVMGIARTGHVYGFAAGRGSRLARFIRSSQFPDKSPLSKDFQITRLAEGASATVWSSNAELMRALGEVHARGWIRGQRLRADGTISYTDASNAVGSTLEAALGVAANSDSSPDFLGWELKSLTTKKPDNVPAGKRLTLMTPEPTYGVYREAGVIEFVRRFGYSDKNGVRDRINFGGSFRFNRQEKNTGLTLKLDGYKIDREGMNGEIIDPEGGLVLVDGSGRIAAGWKFADLMEHWNRKHALAAYVPAVSRMRKNREYRFGSLVHLGEQTDFLRFLGKVADGSVVYDPAIKVENNSSSKPSHKRRSQFRITFSQLPDLYVSFGREDLT